MPLSVVVPVVGGAIVVFKLFAVFRLELELPTLEGLVLMLPAFADRIALPTPTELEALVPAVPGGLLVAPGVPAG